jgi:succinyl-CoA synthetase beta subunit
VNLVEHAAKSLVLRPAGIPVPSSRLCRTSAEAAAACSDIGPSVVKAQVPTGKRGKAGGIKRADSPREAAEKAETILAMTIDGHAVGEVLLEQRGTIVREFYAAVLADFPSRRPMVLFSTEGGMDIEDVAAKSPEKLRRCLVDIERGLTDDDAQTLVAGLGLGAAEPVIVDILVKMYGAFWRCDGELLEINPLALHDDGSVVALDCKFTLDDAAAFRQPALAAAAAPEKMTELESRGAAAGLKFIQLDGNIGVLANGAGLTMTTMDVIHHFGGRPANFLEIGGEAYTKAEIALGLVLSNPGVKSLVVNFCGAFARTEVMAEGVVKAWQRMKPKVPVFFSIHGTGEDEARKLVREGLALEPFDLMEDAVRAAIEAAS